jgi:hypothetical protein
MAIQNILPDPNNFILPDGQATTIADPNRLAGPGFASMSLSSDQPIMRDRTNSGRILSRSFAYHKWTVDISYNPLTRLDFDPVYAFLMQKQADLQPFYVSLPQYLNQATNASILVESLAGSTTLTAFKNVGSLIQAGQIFNVRNSDGTIDSAHTKTYMVTRVDNSGTNAILTTSPKLAKTVPVGKLLNFTTPLVRVIQNNNIQEYSLGTNNLYSFSLKLEEVN